MSLFSRFGLSTHSQTQKLDGGSVPFGRQEAMSEYMSLLYLPLLSEGVGNIKA